MIAEFQLVADIVFAAAILRVAPGYGAVVDAVDLDVADVVIVIGGKNYALALILVALNAEVRRLYLIIRLDNELVILYIA